MTRRQDRRRFVEHSLEDRVALIHEAFEKALQSDEPARIENFIEDLPDEERSSVLPELIAVEVEFRMNRGDSPSPDDYLARFPQASTEIDLAFSRHSSKKTQIEDTKIEAVQSTLAPAQAESPSSHPPVNKHNEDFGDYELIEEIARGGMGVVYKARQVKANRIVALKMILSGKLAGHEEIKRFYTEAEAAANLDHPHIVPVFDVGEIDRQHYFSMGYIEGRSLKDRVKRGPLSSRDAAELLKSIAEAIAYAHEMGVIHRDLKPANVLLDLDGRPRVTDFGLARKVEGGSDLTASGQIMGTPAYMAPEQAAGKTDEVREAADVYALGAILYEMLTGRPPFQAKSTFDVLRQVQEQEPKPLHQLDSSIDRDVETICLKCLEKEQAQRYSSARALMEELGRFLQGQPIQARAITRTERLWRWCKRNRVVASLGSLLVVTGVVIVAVLIFAKGEFSNVAHQDDVAGVADQVKQLESAVQTASEVSLDATRKLYEDPDVLVGKLKSHIRKKAVEQVAQAKANGAKWGAIDKIEKARDSALDRVEDLVESIRKGLAGEPTEVFAEAARILAEDGVEEALKYLESKQSAILEQVDRIIERQAEDETKKRKLLEPLLLKADLHERELAFDDARKQYETVAERAPQWSRARFGLGWLLRELAEYKTAELHLNAAMDLAEDDGQTALAASGLGLLYLEKTRFSEAEPLLRRALAIDERSYSAKHPRIARDLSNLAGLYYVTHRLAEAEPLMRRALAIDEQFHSPNHPSVARDLNNLAGLLELTNRRAVAEALMRRGLAIEEQSRRPDHPFVANQLNNLALLLKMTNRLKEAEPLIRRALAIDEHSYRSNHPQVATRLNNLALLLQASNRLAEAEPLIRHALSIDEQSLGPNHRKVAVSLNELGQLLEATNRPVEAEPLYRRALAIDEEAYGAEHRAIAIVLNNLASLLQAMNRLAEAEPLFRRALAIDEQSYEPDHPDVARHLSDLGWLLKRTNRPLEAELMMRRALTINEQSYGPEHPKVTEDLNNLAQLLQDTNRLAEAEPLMRRTLKIDQRSYDPTHPKIATHLNNLGLLLHITNRLAEAEPLYRNALAIGEKSYGPADSQVAIRLNNLAALLEDTNRLKAAEPISRRCVDILFQYEKRVGRRHYFFLRCLNTYNSILVARGMTEQDVLKLFRAIKPINGPFDPIAPEIERLLGPAKPVAAVLATLDENYKKEKKAAIYFLTADQPIAPHIERLLGPAKLSVPTRKRIAPYLDELLGPSKLQVDSGKTLTEQIDELIGPAKVSVPPNEPVTPHLDRILGPSKLALDPDTPLVGQIDRMLGPTNLAVSVYEPITPHLDGLLGPSRLVVPLDEPISSHLDELLERAAQ